MFVAVDLLQLKQTDISVKQLLIAANDIFVSVDNVVPCDKLLNLSQLLHHFTYLSTYPVHPFDTILPAPSLPQVSSPSASINIHLIIAFSH